MIQDKADLRAGWDDEPAADTVDEFEAKGAAEELALADKLAGGEKLAAADNPAAELLGVEPTKGLSRQTREWERNEGKAAAPAAETNYGHGKDDEFTAEWKKSHADDQREEGIRKYMKLRGATRDQAEREIPHVR